MNPENTQKHSASDSEKLSLILTTVQSFTVRFDNVDSRLNNMDSRLGHVELAVTELREGQQQLWSGQQELRDGQHELRAGYQELRAGQQELREGQLRLHENVLQLQEGQLRLQQGHESLVAEVRALRRSVDYRFTILSGTTLSKIRELDLRVTRLELNCNPPNPQT